MYASRSVCSRCASQVRMPSAARHRLGSSASWFATVADAPPNARQPGEKPVAQRDESRAKLAGSVNGAGNKSRKPAGQKGSSHSLGKHIKTSSRPAKGSSSAPPAKQSAVDLFNDVVKPKDVQTQGNPTLPLGEWEIASKIKELGDRDVELSEGLRIFQSDIWPHISHMAGQLPRHIYLSSSQFLAATADGMAKNGQIWGGIALSEMHASLGKLDLDVRNALVLNLCHQLISQRNTAGQRTAILNELTGFWEHLSQLKRRSQQGRQERHFVLPLVDEIFAGIDWSKAADEVSSRGPAELAPLTRSLAAMFPMFRLEQSRQLAPGLLATIAVLSDPRLVKRQTELTMAPLLNLAAAALTRAQPDKQYLDDMFSAKSRFPSQKLSEVQSYVVAQWPKALAMLTETDANWRRGLKAPSRSESAASSSLSVFHKQLRTAYRSRNTAAVLSIWQDLKTRLKQYPAMARQLREEPEFLDFWIFVWCAVRRPAKLQETLDVMQEIQVHPTVKSYTSMMHGWKMCKDAEKIEALWDKLVGAGVRLDVVIWTERISGLIEVGKPQAGLQALAEMMRTWKAAVAKGATAAAVQPSIEVVNAAFKGLISLDLQAANEVLAWAGREGIEPNVRTYNILLRESFRGETSDDVQSLLKTMKEQGIEPDAATFTIILEEVLGAMSNASTAEQVVAVEQVFADIEAAGLRPNLETYGKMLYAVASLNNGADDAIDAVQAHMHSNGFSATPHMVTILIERALARDPPDIAAVRGLLREHNLTNVSQGDQTLWERVMSAYAVTGDTAQAMAVFNDLAKAGRPVTSLPCLTDLLKALLEDEASAQNARHVVSVVVQHKIKANGNGEPRDNRYWRHHFWYLAREHRLLDWDTVPEDLRRRMGD